MTNNFLFSQKILIWHKNLKIKNLPWQTDKTLYHTWLSEIMLQQTQVKTVIPYYKIFIEKFPTIKTLATAELNEILYLWSGLGYYNRAKNLHKTAKIIFKNYENKFPEDFNTLINLPGIGRSTAGAILSLTLNKKYPILDSNIKRILTRYYAVDYNTIKKSKINNQLWNLIQELIPNKKISVFNQAMMNLGQLICTHKNPKCNICPIQNKCQAFLTHTIQKYPKKISKKLFIKKIMWLLLLFQSCNKKIWLEKRLKPGIWKELFCFPEFSNFNILKNWLLIHNLNNYQFEIMTTLNHKLSNLNLEIKPILLNIHHNKLNYHNKNGIWCELFNLPAVGIPTPISVIIQKLKIKYNNKTIHI